jgi:hypothetical protein
MPATAGKLSNGQALKQEDRKIICGNLPNLRTISPWSKKSGDNR